MRDVIWIASASGAGLAGALLLLQWSRSRARLLVYFAAAFAALAASYVVLLATSGGDESRPYAYVVRLLAFLLIVVAIVDENRPRGADVGD